MSSDCSELVYGVVVHARRYWKIAWRNKRPLTLGCYTIKIFGSRLKPKVTEAQLQERCLPCKRIPRFRGQFRTTRCSVYFGISPSLDPLYKSVYAIGLAGKADVKVQSETKEIGWEVLPWNGRLLFLWIEFMHGHRRIHTMQFPHISWSVLVSIRPRRSNTFRLTYWTNALTLFKPSKIRKRVNPGLIYPFITHYHSLVIILALICCTNNSYSESMKDKNSQFVM